MEEKSRSVRRSREDAEYGQRYAVEPTNNRFSSTQCDEYVDGPPLADKVKFVCCILFHPLLEYWAVEFYSKIFGKLLSSKLLEKFPSTCYIL